MANCICGGVPTSGEELCSNCDEEIMGKTVEALAAAGMVDNAWGAEVLPGVAKRINEWVDPQKHEPLDPRKYAEEALRRNLVRIEPCDPEGQVRPVVGEEPLFSPTLCRWVECAPSEPG